MDQKQEEIYRAILEYIIQNHYPPTVRELCTQCSITSTSVMQKRLKKLERDGKIQITGKTPRSIRLSEYEIVLRKKEKCQGDRK